MKPTPNIKAQPFDCMQYFYSFVQEPIIRCCLRFNERLNREKLAEAAEHLINVFSLLKCKYDIDRHEWVDGSFVLKDYLTIIESDIDFEKAEQESLLSSLRIGFDPPLKIYLIQSKSKDTLCIAVSHMICDGKGFTELLYLLSQFYSESSVHQSGSFEYLMNRKFRQLTKNISFFEKLKIISSKSSIFSKDTQKSILLPNENPAPFLAMKTIEKDSFAHIHQYAKIHSASINDMILTAYVRELHTRFRWVNITLPCPVDLRRFSKSKEECGICNLTGNFFCHVPMTNEEPFEKTLQKVSAQMRAQKESSLCLKGPLSFHLLYHLVPMKTLQKNFFKISPVPVTSYTNIGHLDETKLCFQNAPLSDAFIVTAMKPYPYFQLTVSSFNGKCTLTSCLCADEQNQQLVETLIDGICAELENGVH